MRSDRVYLSAVALNVALTTARSICSRVSLTLPLSFVEDLKDLADRRQMSRMRSTPAARRQWLEHFGLTLDGPAVWRCCKGPNQDDEAVGSARCSVRSNWRLRNITKIAITRRPFWNDRQVARRGVGKEHVVLDRHRSCGLIAARSLRNWLPLGSQTMRSFRKEIVADLNFPLKWQHPLQFPFSICRVCRLSVPLKSWPTPWQALPLSSCFRSPRGQHVEARSWFICSLPRCVGCHQTYLSGRDKTLTLPPAGHRKRLCGRKSVFTWSPRCNDELDCMAHTAKR